MTHRPSGDYCLTCGQTWPCVFSIEAIPLDPEQVEYNRQIVADMRERIRQGMRHAE